MNHLMYYHVLLIVALYAGLFISLYGWGCITFKILKFDRNSAPDHVFILVWVGWAVALLFMQFIHLFFPLDWRVSTFVYLSGGVFTIATNFRRLTQLKNEYQPADLIRLMPFLLCMLVVAVWATFNGMGPIEVFDSGLYHFNIIRWINSHPIIPGLGNLHSRFAFNESYFVYAASLNFFPYFPYAHSVANAFLYLLVFAELTWRLFALARKDLLTILSDPFSYVPYAFGLLIITYIGLITEGLSSPTPDLASTLIQFILFLWFIRIIVEMRAQKISDGSVLAFFILAVTALTLKLSNLVFSTTLLGICFLYAMKFPGRKALFARFFRPVVLASSIILIWAARGVYLSGYPFYPSTFGGMPVEWAIPANVVRDLVDVIFSWARMRDHRPDEVLGNWNWLGPWVDQLYVYNQRTIIYPFQFATGFAIISLVIAIFQHKLRALYNDLIFFIPCVAGILFWFLTAPDPRFANALFFLLLLTSILVFVRRLYDLAGIFPSALIIENSLLLTMVFMVQGPFMNVKYHFQYSYVSIHKVELIERKTDSGLIVYSPAEGDQCWDSPLPCTPHFNSKLKLRIPGRIDSGFLLE